MRGSWKIQSWFKGAVHRKNTIVYPSEVFPPMKFWEIFTQLFCRGHKSTINLVHTTKVPFKESLFTRQPHLQRLGAAILLIQEQLLSIWMGKYWKLLLKLTTDFKSAIKSDMNGCFLCSNSVKGYISGWSSQWSLWEPGRQWCNGFTNSWLALLFRRRDLFRHIASWSFSHS